MENGLAKDNENRAGYYAPQIGGYKSFVPKPLCSGLDIIIDLEMSSLLSKADIALGRLDGMGEYLPNPLFFIAMYVNKEAVLSSQIEGTQASLIDVLAFEADAADPQNPQDVEEVVNYIAALNLGISGLNELPPSRRLLRNIHAELMKGVRGSDRTPGEFRQTQNWIGNTNSNIKTARFVPPSPTDMQAALDDLEKFLNEQTDLPTLLKIGIVHSQFETIHPFLDGNGRMGRLLITFLLVHQNILKVPLLYLSYYLKANRIEYYSLLQNVRDKGDWESWLKFFLKGVYEVATEATENIRKINQLRESHRNLVMSEFQRSTGNAITLLEYLYERPIVTVRGVSEVTGITFANANLLVNRFVEKGILREMRREARYRRFMYFNYLNIVAENEAIEAVTGVGVPIEKTVT